MVHRAYALIQGGWNGGLNADQTLNPTLQLPAFVSLGTLLKFQLPHLKSRDENHSTLVPRGGHAPLHIFWNSTGLFVLSSGSGALLHVPDDDLG